MTLDHKLILKEIQDYVFITLGLLLYSFGFTVFLMPYEIVSGGVTGISAIIFYATGFNIEYTYLIINVGLLAVALRVLGWRFLSKTVFAILMLSFFLGLFRNLMPVDENGHFVKIAASVNKFRDVSLGTVLAFLDLIIIGSCLLIPAFGDMLQRAYMVVFGLCTMVIESYMIDFLMNRQRQSVQFMIFSKKWEEIANAIATKLDHGVTILDGHGWYTGHDRKVLCILAKKRESQIIFRIIKSIDPQAFVSQSAVIGVFGEGFDQIKVKGIEN